jgi:poly(3-hydroxybutyrate) depolymerase
MRRLAAALAFAVLAGCGSADARGARVETFKVHSRAVGRALEVRVVLPAGETEGRPLVVFLHGRGMSPASFTGDDAVFAGLAKLGDRAPILAFPYGGDHSYWHDRANGDWGRYVLREVIPQVLERTGADRRRVALGGISMGGFGAYDLATRAKRHFCAVAGHSPALWRTAGETAPGAFDDAGDFARHDVIRRAGRLGGTRLWLDAGDTDPFLPGDRAFADAAGIPLRLAHGGHDSDYWDRNWPRYLRFYARACATS